MNISYKLYGLLLLAYPPEFRQRFANEMLQVFRDCYAHETSRRTLAGFWLWTLSDLIVSATKERAYRAQKEGLIMNRNLLLAAIGIILIAFLLLTYGRRNEIGSILVFGYVLDALVTTGVIGNLIVFVFSKATKWNPLRTAIWTFAIIHGFLLLLAVFLAGANDPRFNLAATVIGYVVSFAIWAGLHFAWRHRPPVYS